MTDRMPVLEMSRIELRQAGIWCPVSLPMKPFQGDRPRARAQRTHSQTLEELARRGGLSPAEALAILEDRSVLDGGVLRDFQALPWLLALLEVGVYPRIAGEDSRVACWCAHVRERSRHHVRKLSPGEVRGIVAECMCCGGSGRCAPSDRYPWTARCDLDPPLPGDPDERPAFAPPDPLALGVY